MSESQRRRLYVAAKGLLQAVSVPGCEAGLREALEEVNCEIALALQASPRRSERKSLLETVFA